MFSRQAGGVPGGSSVVNPRHKPPACGPMQRSGPRLGGCEPFLAHIPPALHADGCSLAWIWGGGQEKKRKYCARKRFCWLGLLGRVPGGKSSCPGWTTLRNTGSTTALRLPAFPDHYRHRGLLHGEAVDPANPASTSAGRTPPWPWHQDKACPW